MTTNIETHPGAVIAWSRAHILLDAQNDALKVLLKALQQGLQEGGIVASVATEMDSSKERLSAAKASNNEESEWALQEATVSVPADEDDDQ